MFFKNLTFFQIKTPVGADLGKKLEAAALQPCAATLPISVGWIKPRGGQYAYTVNNQILIALGVEEKLLPSSVVKKFASDKAKEIEEAEGRKVGRKELRELTESAMLWLLPQAFVRTRSTFGWIDPVNNILAINSASTKRVEEFMECLHETLEGIKFSIVKTKNTPSSAMTGWVSVGEAPDGFTIDQDLNLDSPEHAQVRYVKHTLDGEDIRNQIAEGKVATKLAMTWNDRISFVLTDAMQLKRLSFLDILKKQSDGKAENEEEQFDIDFTIFTGESARLLDCLVEALGEEASEE